MRCFGRITMVEGLNLSLRVRCVVKRSRGTHDALHPKISPGVPKTVWHVLVEEIRVPKKHMSGEQFDSKVRIELEKGPEQVLLIPAASFPQPITWIFEPGKNVVEVHDNTGGQGRQNMEKERVNIAPGLGHVA